MLLVASGDELPDSGFGGVPALGVQQISPAEFAKRAESDLARYSSVIFHRSAPARPPSVPTLLILPPADNPLFPVRDQADEGRITSWAAEHPITSYLKVPLLSPGSAAIFDVPLWAQSIMRVEEGAIVVAGESHGVRFAAVGMEMLPFEGARTPVLSVLTLNLLNWLSGGTELTASALSSA